MRAKDGISEDMASLEDAFAAQRQGQPRTEGTTRAGRNKGLSPEARKWLEREGTSDWLRTWMGIEPALGRIDLRPYVFVARDKRPLAAAAGLGSLDELVAMLSSSGLAVRAAETTVKALDSTDAESVFNALREQFVRSADFGVPPPGTEGLAILAKHHKRHQSELVSLLEGLDARALGVWVVRGWSEAITEASAKARLDGLMTRWAQQSENARLAKAAGFAQEPTGKKSK